VVVVVKGCKSKRKKTDYFDETHIKRKRERGKERARERKKERKKEKEAWPILKLLPEQEEIFWRVCIVFVCVCVCVCVCVIQCY